MELDFTGHKKSPTIYCFEAEYSNSAVSVLDEMFCTEDSSLKNGVLDWKPK